jgi:hypothetical protein
MFEGFLLFLLTLITYGEFVVIHAYRIYESINRLQH